MVLPPGVLGSWLNLARSQASRPMGDGHQCKCDASAVLQNVCHRWTVSRIDSCLGFRPRTTCDYRLMPPDLSGVGYREVLPSG